MDDSLSDEVEDLEIFEDAENSEEPQNLPVDTNQEDPEGENKGDQDDEEKEKKVKPKRIIRNPRVILNVERLKGPKGLGVLEGCFEKVKFKGKGYEEGDLNVLLKTYEYWCHRLFPKFSFQDSIAKIEKLGFKGPIQTHLKKVRSGMIEDDDPTVSGVAADIRSDEEAGMEETAASQTATQSATQTIIEDIPIELTEEQLETIRRNRAKAETLRQERLKKIQEKASLSLPESNIAAPISQHFTDTMDEEQSLENSITKLQETTREASDENDPEENDELFRNITTSGVEDCLKVSNDFDEVDVEQNELKQQSIEDDDVENGLSSIVGKELNSQASNDSMKQISDDETAGGSENETEKMIVDPEQ